MHFFSNDRKALYRARKFRMNSDPDTPLDFTAMAEAVNVDVPDHQQVTPQQIRLMLAASNVVSADDRSRDEESASVSVRSGVARYAAPAEDRPDVRAEAKDLQAKLYAAAAGLPIFLRKVLRLHGVAVPMTVNA